MDVLGVIIVKMLIRAAIGALIGAVFLRAAAKWVAGQDVPYGKAYGLYFLSHLIFGSITIVLGFGVGIYTGATGRDIDQATMLAILIPAAGVLGIVASAGVIGASLSLRYPLALLVTTVMYGMAVVVFGSIALFVYLFPA